MSVLKIIPFWTPMVYYTCNIDTSSGRQELARCLLPMGSIIIDDKWNWISTSLVPIARTILVATATLAIWHLWWWRRYSSMNRQTHHGSSWAIGTSMTHMSGLNSTYICLRTAMKYGIEKVTSTLLILLVGTGIVLPLASIYWASHVFQNTMVQYEYKTHRPSGDSIVEAIKGRTALVSSFGQVTYGEKPLLTSDVFLDIPVGMESATILRPPGIPSWWKVDITPKALECHVEFGDVLESSSNVEFYVNYGDYANSIVAESLTSRCGRVIPSVNFLTNQDFEKRNPELAASLKQILDTNRAQQWCKLNYTCPIETKISYGNISVNNTQKIQWQQTSLTTTHENDGGLMSQLQDEKMKSWLESDQWKEKAIGTIKEAASIKYNIYSSLGQNQPAHQVLSETFNEFFREAILQSFDQVEIQFNGATSRLQFSWLSVVLWAIIVLSAVTTLSISNINAKKLPLLKEMLESWDIISKTSVISDGNSGTSDIPLYRWPTVYDDEKEADLIN
ncbi:hypothetical protein K493DRAFT_303591 [Basidiobolus meristosporus CBS 931.73]|uniref:Uncharacterized protein n=1 Tax=Basidiobolus meristosporus CBS 931.73 TaxID=1314790 RepID=A0A1Y1Y238_9FUNG|nr:hypothetical protein K493DRAFT_303591 [Basidiobolus meristosporus CBS 931.73]|eukprot:ORX92081.1 hypothetical protein K493DRAFT_303591 [Basidiobolus meristosporus CBS 931.73]